MLVNIAQEYNEAVLVVENNNIGWAAIQQIIDRDYQNLFYMSKDLKWVDTQRQASNKIYRQEKQMVPGFTMSMKTRPLIVAKLEEFFREKLVKVNSKRLIDELFVFIYNGQRAEAMSGYNDDLVISYGIALWIRETALRLRAEGIELQKKSLDSINSVHSALGHSVYTNKTPEQETWEWEIKEKKESLEWLL